MGILSVRLSVLVSRPGTEPSPGEIETPGLHHMIAWVSSFQWGNFGAAGWGYSPRTRASKRVPP